MTTAVAMYSGASVFSPVMTTALIVAVVALGPVISWIANEQTQRIVRALAIATLIAVAVTLATAPTEAAVIRCDWPCWWF